MALLLVAACGGGGDAATEELAEVPSGVEIESTAGDITINAAANVSGTTVEYEKSWSGDEPTADVELTDGVLRLADDCAENAECSVDWVVSFDGDAGVQVSSGAGNVRLVDVVGDVRIDSGAGDITLATVAGSIEVAAGAGTILGTRLEGSPASFETGAGDIDVTFDEPPETLVAVVGAGDITVQLPGGPYAVETTDVVGNVEIQVDEDPAAANTVSLTTGAGDITVYRR